MLIIPSAMRRSVLHVGSTDMLVACRPDGLEEPSSEAHSIAQLSRGGVMKVHPRSQMSQERAM